LRTSSEILSCSQALNLLSIFVPKKYKGLKRETKNSFFKKIIPAYNFQFLPRQSRSQRPRAFWSATGIGTSGIIRLPTTGFLLSTQLRRPEPIRATRSKKLRFLRGDSVFFRQIRTYGITKRLHDALRPLLMELFSQSGSRYRLIW